MKQTLLILMAVALVGCGKIAAKRKEAQITGCKANLRSIQSAIMQHSLSKADDHEVTMDDIKNYLHEGTIPQCPSGGEYEVTTVGEEPYCTIEGHTLYEEEEEYEEGE